jgi:hypothetical protein
MNTERIFKNILWRPEEAFKPDVLRETFPAAIGVFIVLGLISAIFSTPQKIQRINFISRHPALLQIPHLIPVIFFALIFIGLCVQMAAVRFFLQSEDRSVDLKTLISGAVWIYGVTVPLGWILGVVWFKFGRLVIVPYRIWLMTACIHGVADLPMWTSFWVYVRAILLFMVVVVVVGVAVAVSYGSRIRF